MADDFPAATPQERFLCMLVERVGALEQTTNRIAVMLEDVHRFLMTDSLRCFMIEPDEGVAVDAALLEKIVAAVQKNARVVVKHALMTPFSTIDHRPAVSVYLKLKDSVVPGQVSPSLCEHIASDVGTPRSEWEAATVEHMESVRAVPGVYELSFFPQ